METMGAFPYARRCIESDTSFGVGLQAFGKGHGYKPSWWLTIDQRHRSEPEVQGRRMS